MRIVFGLLFMLPAYAALAQDNQLSADTLKQMSLEELMNIEVTSVSRRAEKLQLAASAIQVITRDDIRMSGATCVPEALRLANNLQVAQVNASQWAISARGFNNVLANKLLVLIDGRVVYTPMYAGVFWDVQNLLLEDVERIEVISGPGGTLWGSNAVNGVINIITRKASDTQGLFAEAAAGTEVRGLASIRYGGKISDNISFRVYGTGFKRDNTIFADSIDAADDWQLAQGGFRTDWTGNQDEVMLQANHYDGRPDPDGNNPVVARGTNIITRWGRTISERSGLQVQLYYDQTWRDFRNDFTEKLKTYDVEAQHRFAIGERHDIIYGAGIRYMDHEVENLEGFAFRPAQKSLYLYNMFVQDDILLIREKLRLTLGIKVEHHTYTDFQYQPNARLNWTLSNQHTIWAAASRAVRNPARIDREFYLDLLPGLPFIAGSNVQTEKVLAYELGWRAQFAETIFLSVSSFYNIYDDIRSVEPGPPPFGLPVVFANGVEGETYGVELAATFQPSANWRLRGGYTLLKKDLRIKPGSQDANNASAESNDPQHQILLQSSWKLTPRLELGSVARYISELPDPKVSEYVGLDIRVGWKIFEFLELNIVGQNLVGDSHEEFTPSSPAPKGIERSVYGKLVLRLE